MSRLALVVTLEVAPDAREEVLQALLAHRERCLSGEPGTLQFEVLVPTDEPSKIFLFELYADSAAFEAHAKGTSMAAYREEVGDRVLKFTHARCTPANG